MSLLKRSNGVEAKQQCGPMMMVVMASLVILAVLTLILFEGRNVQAGPKPAAHPLSHAAGAP